MNPNVTITQEDDKVTRIGFRNTPDSPEHSLTIAIETQIIFADPLLIVARVTPVLNGQIRGKPFHVISETPA